MRKLKTDTKQVFQGFGEFPRQSVVWRRRTWSKPIEMSFTCYVPFFSGWVCWFPAGAERLDKEGAAINIEPAELLETPQALRIEKWKFGSAKIARTSGPREMGGGKEWTWYSALDFPRGGICLFLIVQREEKEPSLRWMKSYTEHLAISQEHHR